MTAKITPVIAGGLAVAAVATTALASPVSCPSVQHKHVVHHHTAAATAYRHPVRGPYPTYAAYAGPEAGYPAYSEPAAVPAYGPGYYGYPGYGYSYPAGVGGVYYGGPYWYGGYWGPGYWRHGYWGRGGWGRGFHGYGRHGR
jgi:hypothetical protein